MTPCGMTLRGVLTMFAEGREAHKIEKISQSHERGCQAAGQLNNALHVDGWLERADMVTRDDYQIQNNVDSEFYRADDQGDIRLVQRSRGRCNSSLNRTTQDRERGNAYVGQARSPHLFRHKTVGKSWCSAEEDYTQDESQQRLECDQSVSQLEALCKTPGCFVSNDYPGSPWKTLVDGLRGGVHIGIGICCNHH